MMNDLQEVQYKALQRIMIHQKYIVLVGSDE